MPLRDHFHSPVNDRHAWDELHGTWPTFIVMALKAKLSPGYVAVPKIHLGTFIETPEFPEESSGSDHSGGIATATWTVPKPAVDVIGEPPDQDEYEVRVYDIERNRRLVAAVEIISPSNKDRLDSRRLFAGKCATLLYEGVSVAIVDLVTIRHANLYSELLEFVGQTDPSFGADTPTTYAAVCRWTQKKKPRRFQSWTNSMRIGDALPTLPLWLTDDLAVPLELESPYEQACALVNIR